jgi:hypothetical protein
LTPEIVGQVCVLEHGSCLGEDSLKGPFRTAIFPRMLNVRKELFSPKLLVDPGIELFVEKFRATVELPCFQDGLST